MTIIPSSLKLPTDQRVPLTADYINELIDLINAGESKYDVVPKLFSDTDVIWYDSETDAYTPTTIEISNASIWQQSAVTGTVTGWATSGLTGTLSGLATDEVRTFTPTESNPTFGATGIIDLQITVSLAWTDSGAQTADVVIVLPVVDQRMFLELVDFPVVRGWSPFAEQRLENNVTGLAHYSALNMSSYPSIYPVSSWRWTVVDYTASEILPGNTYSLASGSHLGLPDSTHDNLDYSDGDDAAHYWKKNDTAAPDVDGSGNIVCTSETVHFYAEASTYTEWVLTAPNVEAELVKVRIYFSVGSTGATITLDPGAVAYQTNQPISVGWLEIDVTAYAAAFSINITELDGNALTIDETEFVWEYYTVTDKLELDFALPGNYIVKQTATVPAYTPQTLTHDLPIRVSPAYEVLNLPTGGVVAAAKTVALSNAVEAEVDTDMPMPYENGRSYLQVTWGIEGTDGTISKIKSLKQSTAEARTTRREKPLRGKSFYRIESAALTSSMVGQYCYFPNLEVPCPVTAYQDGINIIEVPTSYFGLVGFPKTSITFSIGPAGERTGVEVNWSYNGQDYRRQKTVWRNRQTEASTYTRFYNIPASAASITASVTPATGITYAPKTTSVAYSQTLTAPTAVTLTDVEVTGTTYGALVTFPKVTGAAGYLVRAYETWGPSEVSEQSHFIEQPSGLLAMIPIVVDNGRPVSIDVFTVGEGNVLSASVNIEAMGGSLTIDDTGFTHNLGTFIFNNDITGNNLYHTLDSDDEAWEIQAVVDGLHLGVHQFDSNVHIKRIKCSVHQVNSDCAATSTTGVITSVVDYSATLGGTIKVTSVGHGLNQGDTIAVAGTLNYNDEYVVGALDSGDVEYSAGEIGPGTGHADKFILVAPYVIAESTGNWAQAEVTIGFPLILAVDDLDEFVYVWPEIYQTGYFEYPVDLYVPAKTDIRMTMYKEGWFKYPTNLLTDATHQAMTKITVMYDYDRNVSIEAQQEKPVFKKPAYQTVRLAKPTSPSDPPILPS